MDPTNSSSAVKDDPSSKTPTVKTASAPAVASTPPPASVATQSNGTVVESSADPTPLLIKRKLEQISRDAPGTSFSTADPKRARQDPVDPRQVDPRIPLGGFAPLPGPGLALGYIGGVPTTLPIVPRTSLFAEIPVASRHPGEELVQRHPSLQQGSVKDANGDVVMQAAEGGIFDDADEDTSKLPKSEMKPGQAGVSKAAASESGPPVKRMDGLSPDQRTAIRAIVTGGVVPKPVALAPKPAGGSTEPGKPAPADQKGEPKKKRVSRPPKKVLVAKKEKDIAAVMIRDKHDLLNCIPSSDCEWLGKTFWIFTIPQLAYVVGLPATGTTKYPDDWEAKSKKLRNEIIAELCFSSLLDLGRSSEVAGAETGAQPADEKPEEKMIDEGKSDVKEEAVDKEGGVDKVDDADKEKKAVQVTATKDGVANSSDAAPETLPDQTQSANRPVKGSVLSAPFSEKPRRVPTLEEFAVAKHFVDSWKEAIVKFRGASDDSKIIPREQRFPLDGTIGHLIPASTYNFLTSIKVKTLWEFLCMKKTETGAICDLLRIWRSKCGLPELSALANAKHLLGVSSRIETAIAAIPPLDAKTRKWMNDPIIVMTGAAREFLVDEHNIFSARKFVNTRTKDLASRLVEWREKKGLVPLKGSGKVAMISGWKAGAREAIEAEASPGKVIPDIDLDNITSEVPIKRVPDAATSTATKPSRSKPKPAKKSPPSRKGTDSSNDRQMRYALHSKPFVEDILGDEVSGVLGAGGVDTAAELFEADTSPESDLCRALLKAKKIEAVGQCQEAVSKWVAQLKEALDALCPPKRVASPKAPAKPNVQPEKATSEATSRRVHPSTHSTAYGILSASTQKFLSSMGITTAEQFLSTRTTDIATEFVKWRVREGKPELKGLGAIASVSGWKAMCRRMAKDIGQDALAELEPVTKAVQVSSYKDHRRALRIRGQPESSQENVTREGFLGGKPRVDFAVQHDRGKQSW